MHLCLFFSLQMYDINAISYVFVGVCGLSSALLFYLPVQYIGRSPLPSVIQRSSVNKFNPIWQYVRDPWDFYYGWDLNQPNIWQTVNILLPSLCSGPDHLLFWSDLTWPDKDNQAFCPINSERHIYSAYQKRAGNDVGNSPISNEQHIGW